MDSQSTMNAETLELLKRSAAVPSVPHVVTRFLEITQDPDFEYGDLVEVLSTDAGIASEVLRLANSALFGVTRQVTTLRQALPLLGLRRVRSLVLGRYMVQSISAGGSGKIDMSYYWRRSLASAVLSARFADALQPDDVVDLEREALGVTHADVSALVLEHWQLPDLIVSAVRYHHTWPLAADLPEDVSTCARIANGSSRIAKLLCEKPEPEQVRKVCTEAMNLIGLEMSVLAGVLAKIVSDIDELAQILRVDVIPSKIYELIAGQVKALISEQAEVDATSGAS